MGLADAGRPQQQQRVAVSHPTAGGELTDLRLVERGLGGEVEAVEIPRMSGSGRSCPPSRCAARPCARSRARRGRPAPRAGSSRAAPPRRSGCRADRGWRSTAAGSAIRRAVMIDRHRQPPPTSRFRTRPRAAAEPTTLAVGYPGRGTARRAGADDPATPTKWAGSTSADAGRSSRHEPRPRPGVADSHPAPGHHDGDALADQPPGRRIEVAVDLDGAVGSPPGARVRASAGKAGDRRAAATPPPRRAQSARRRLAGRAVHARIGDLAHPPTRCASSAAQLSKRRPAIALRLT